MTRRGLRTAAAALTFVALAPALAACGSAKGKTAADSHAPVAPTTSAPAAKIESLREHCPPVASVIAYPPGGKIPNPDKVVGVRMCNGQEEFTAQDGTDYDIAPPIDEVTSAAAQLVQIVNGSDPVTAKKCFDDKGPNLVFWFRYADNTARAVVDQRYDCRPLHVGPNQTTNAGDALYLGFLKALAAQRAAGPPPKASQPTPTCDIEQTTTPLDLTAGLDLSAADFCTDQGGGKTAQAALSADQLAKVNQDFKTSTTSPTDACGGPPRWLAGTTVYGDHVVLKGLAGTCAFAVPNVIPQQSGYFWTPSADIEQLFQRLTAKS